MQAALVAGHLDIRMGHEECRAHAVLVEQSAQVGFVLQIREPRWHEHRCLVAISPPANLHVWSPDSPEAVRHRILVENPARLYFA